MVNAYELDKLALELEEEFDMLQVSYNDKTGMIRFHYVYGDKYSDLKGDEYHLEKVENGEIELTRYTVDGNTETRLFWEGDMVGLKDVIGKIEREYKLEEFTLYKANHTREGNIADVFDKDSIEKERVEKENSVFKSMARRYLERYSFTRAKEVVYPWKLWDYVDDYVEIIELEYALKLDENLVTSLPKEGHTTMTRSEYKERIKDETLQLIGEDGEDIEVVACKPLLKDIYAIVEGSIVLVDG